MGGIVRHLPCSHVSGVALAVVEDIPPDLPEVCFFRLVRILPDADGPAYFIEQTGLAHYDASLRSYSPCRGVSGPDNLDLLTHPILHGIFEGFQFRYMSQNLS